MSSTLIASPQTPVRTPDALRPLLVLVLFAAGNAWFGAAVQSAIDSGEVLSAVIVAFLTLIVYGVIGIPLLCLALLPGVILTMAFLRRTDPSSRRARFGAGAAAWAGWGLVTLLATQAVPSENRAPSAFVVLVFIAGAIQGGLYSILAFDRPWRGPGKVLVAAALVVSIFVVGGALVTAMRPSAGAGVERAPSGESARR